MARRRHLHVYDGDREREGVLFNENADPSQGNFGNWPQEFVQYNLNSSPLGQVDPTVTADTPSYAAFIQDGQRSFVAFNPTSQTIEVTFHDAQSGAVLAELTVGVGQLVTQLGSGQLLTDRLEDYQVPNQGASLYLLRACFISWFLYTKRHGPGRT